MIAFEMFMYEAGFIYDSEYEIRRGITVMANILKIRDDNNYFSLTKQETGFSFGEETQIPSWLPERKQSGEISLSVLRSGIEPWLTSLFQSEHLAVLAGNGLSKAIQYLATGSSNSAMSLKDIDSAYKDRLQNAAEKTAQNSSRGEPNIEDSIRVISELMRGLEILGVDEGKENGDFTKLNDEYHKLIADFTDSISAIESSIASANEAGRENAFNYLVNFLMSFACRTGTRERLNIFTTNYDRLIEAGAEIAGLHLLDRFVGTLAPIFRSSRLDIDMHYNPPGMRGEPRYLEGVARFTKLHGSIDWIDTGNDIRRIGLPFGSKDINSFLNAPGLSGVDSRKIMIYPNSAKDRETSEYPYVELFRDFAAALCRPNTTLVTYGYGFGDDHINRVIKDMLTIPSTHLVIISYNDIGEQEEERDASGMITKEHADGRVVRFYKELGRPSQVSMLIGKDIADLKILVDYFMPKPAIDKASMRMNELLKQRYSAPPSKTAESDCFNAAEAVGGEE